MANSETSAKLAHFEGAKSPPVDMGTNKTYADLILEKMSSCQDEVAFVDLTSDRKFTCGQVRQESIGLAKVLQSSVKKGDVCCICSYNIPEFAVALYGSTVAGMTVMLCNALYSYYEMNHQIEDSTTSVLFIPGDKLFLEKSLKAVQDTPVHTIVLITPPEDTEYLNACREEQTKVKILQLAEMIAESEKNETLKLPTHEWDLETEIAIIPYSSGTTGKAKGVQLTHAVMIQHLKSFYLMEKMSPKTTTRTTFFTVPPMFHIFGFIMSCLGAYSSQTIFLQRRFNFIQLLEAIQRERISRLVLVPAIMTQLAKDPVVEKYDLKCVRVLVVGSAPMPRKQLEALQSRFDPENPPVFTQAYAMTESSGTYMSPSTPKEVVLAGSVGKPVMDTEIKVVDLESLETVTVNKEGEIWLRSKARMFGYLNRKEDTEKTITPDGWVRTGDIGYFSEEGYLFITDRIKELIKYKGYQVPPAELEELLLTHPAVQDCGVAGKPDDEAGQLPTAFVVLKQETQCSEDELKLFVKERSAPYKQLKGGVFFIDKVPRNAAGKILRRTLFELVNQKLQ